MANNKKITALNSLAEAASNDVFAIVDVNQFETKKITSADLFATPQPIGSSNPNTGKFSVLTVGGNPINEFSTDGTLAGNSDTVIPSEKAIKSYVDNAVGNAVKLNIVHTSLDSTAQIGDVYIVDTTAGDVNIILNPTGIGKIIVYKNSNDNNIVNITTISGTIYGPHFVDVGEGSNEYICDGSDFYII